MSGNETYPITTDFNNPVGKYGEVKTAECCYGRRYQLHQKYPERIGLPDVPKHFKKRSPNATVCVPDNGVPNELGLVFCGTEACADSKLEYHKRVTK